MQLSVQRSVYNEQYVSKKKEEEYDATKYLQFAEIWAPNFYIEQREGQVYQEECY